MATKKASKAAKSTKKASKGGAKATRATGSQKLAAAGKGAGLLSAALLTLNRKRLNHDILIRGIPIPDIITGTIRARNAKELGDALTTLFQIRGAEYKPIRLFPKGIPVIDIIEAQIEGRLRKG
jgi:hypothetical protein